jgi:hypothetical protein
LNNTAFSVIAIYNSISNSRFTNHVIESAVAIVSLPWSTIPDLSSQFVKNWRSFYVIIIIITAPWFHFDVSDVWMTKTLEFTEVHWEQILR